MDSFSNQSFYQGRVFTCTNCGFPMHIDLLPPASTLNHSMQEYNLLEESIKPQSNQGDCDEPVSSSGEEPEQVEVPEPVQSEKVFKSFKTNLSNNRWLRGKCKEILSPMKRLPPSFSRSFVYRKPVNRPAKSQPPVEKPTKVVKIDLYRTVSKSKASNRVPSSADSKDTSMKTINLVEQLKKPKLLDSSRKNEAMPPQPKPYKLYNNS